MSIATKAPPQLNSHAQRCEPYNDGHWCFAYDPAHTETLRELGAHDALLGWAAGLDRAARLERLTDEGLVVAWELTDDHEVVVDVIVGKRMTSGQKKKAEWIDPQRSYLSVPSGRLRIETLNSLRFSPDDPTDTGVEIELSPGDYDVALHRVNWALMDADIHDRPEIPTEVLVLHPVKPKGPKKKSAALTLADVMGEDGAWLVDGRLEGQVFHGTTRKHTYDTSIIHLNLRGTHAEKMGLVFGQSLRLSSGDQTVELPFTGFVGMRGIPTFLGSEWTDRHLGSGEKIAGFSVWGGSGPVIVDLKGSDLEADTSVEVTLGEPWCEAPDGQLEACEAKDGTVTGRIVWVSANSIVLNFGWDQLRKAGIDHGDVLQFQSDGVDRIVYLDASPRESNEAAREALLTAARPERPALQERLQAAWSRSSNARVKIMLAEQEGGDPAPWLKTNEEAEAEVATLRERLRELVPGPDELSDVPLYASTMTWWDDLERHAIWLCAFIGDAHFAEIAVGSPVTLSRREEGEPGS